MQQRPVPRPGTPPLLRREEPPPPRTPVVAGGVTLPQFSDLLQGDAPLAAGAIDLVCADEEDRIWPQIENDLIRGSLSYFFSTIIRGPAEHPYNGRSLCGRHHEDWDDIVLDERRAVVLAARDHGKSHFFSLGYPIWRAGWTHPGGLGYLIGGSKDQARLLLALVAAELLSNPRLAHLLPADRDAGWNKDEITLANGSVIRCRGFGVRLRGAHPAWVICDDILTDLDIYSQRIRERHIDFFLSAIEGMVHVDHQLLVVGTPMHRSDLYGYLAEGGSYAVHKFPAIDKATGRVLFPERYSKRALKLKKRALQSPTRFAREYLCEPLSDEASLFPDALFDGPINVPYRLGLPVEVWLERGCYLYTGVDLAFSAEAWADFTVVLTIAIDPQGRHWLVNIRRGKGLPLKRQLAWIQEEAAKYNPEKIFIEANQAQRVFSDELREETDLPVVKFFTAGNMPAHPWKTASRLTMGKHDLDRGVPSLRLLLENQKLRLPRGDAKSIGVTDYLRGELQSLSWQNGQVVSVGPHDDVVMALWFAVSGARMGRLQWTFADADDRSPRRPPPPARPADIARYRPP